MAVPTAFFIARRNETRLDELLGDALGDQLSVELRLLHLDDVEADVRRLAVDLRFHLLELRAESLGLASHDGR